MSLLNMYVLNLSESNWIFLKSFPFNFMGYSNLLFQHMWFALSLAALMAAFIHILLSWLDGWKSTSKDI